jgi:hypothetical protein
MQGSGTVAVNMWSQPLRLSDTTDALVLDSQALCNPDVSFEINNRLLKICLIIASQFVLSTVGHVSDHTFEDLTPFLETNIPTQDV